MSEILIKGLYNMYSIHTLYAWILYLDNKPHYWGINGRNVRKSDRGGIPLPRQTLDINRSTKRITVYTNYNTNTDIQLADYKTLANCHMRPSWL